MSEMYAPPHASPLVGFRSRKAAQVAAYFALRSDWGVERLKLVKLIYLAERQFLGDYHFPMLFDELYSLPHGPVCSSTLNGINGVIHLEVWENFITRNGNVVWAVKRFSRDQLDEISDAEIAVLDEVWKRFGGLTSSQLRNYTHQNCPEYTEIETGRVPISYRDVLEALEDPDAEQVDREIGEYRRTEGMLSG